MLAERLGKAWRTLQASVPIDAEMKFAPEGLVLGAGTVLAPTDAGGATIRFDGREARLVTLLSVAHLRPVTPNALNHIRKAAERWGEGETSLAEVHLALSRLAALDEPWPAAQRLFLTDELLKAGVEPETVLKALDLDPSTLDSLAKGYNPDQPRVPAGSGRASGQWTSGAAAGGVASRLSNLGVSTSDRTPPADATAVADPDPAPSAADVGTLAIADADTAASANDFGVPASGAVGALPGSAEWLTLLSRARLIALAAAIAPAAVGGVALNLILVPNKSLRREGVIPGQPPIQYLWHSDDRSLVLSSTTADGLVHSAIGVLGADGGFRDERGRVIGRLLPNGTVLVLLGALASAKVSERSEPDLCPAPGPDKSGRNVAIDRDFEDYVKEFVNPGNPTPRGYGYQLPNPNDAGKLVFFDDCQHHTGDMQEDKRGYAEIITNGKKDFLKVIIGEKWLGQSKNQLDASVGRALVWNFSNQIAADYARALFIANDQGRENIEIRVMPWTPGKTWY